MGSFFSDFSANLNTLDTASELLVLVLGQFITNAVEERGKCVSYT